MPEGSNTPPTGNRDDTGPISTALVQAAAATPGPPRVTAHEIAAVLVELGGAGGNGPPSKKFLALSGGEWTKIVLGMVIMGLVAFGGWLLVVRDAVRDSVKRPELRNQIEKHSTKPHPDSASKEDVEYIHAEVRNVQTTQIEIKKDVEHIGDKIDDMAKDVRRIRRRSD